MSRIVEQDIEDAALDILQSDLGYKYICGYEIAPDGENPERERWDDVILSERLKEAVSRINPEIPADAQEQAIKKLRLRSAQIVQNNEKFHKFLTDGIPVEYRADGRIKGDSVWLFDFNNPDNNEFLAVNQFTIVENNKNRRPDIVIFINGIPIGIIELKNPADENATVTSAYKQLQTYKQEIPSIFNFNELLVVSDGTLAQLGTLTSPKEWFLPWKTLDGKEIAPSSLPQLQVVLEGVFKKEIILDVMRHFITFFKSKKQTTKIIAGYHQYYAANKAIDATIKATQSDKKIGVIWHTQGSGKSYTLAFYASKLALKKELNNPTLLVLTDRNDLDDQLFNTFSGFELLREKPIQAKSKEDLKEKLRRSSGGIIFATIQKFGLEGDMQNFETLSTRRNIIVAADEAHRSHYGFRAKVDQETGRTKYGLAKYLRDALPNASFIGFTGTPLELEDKSTQAIFGDYIDIYDIGQAVEDNRTVRIYYESRLAKLTLKEDINLDEDFEEVTEGEEETKKDKLKSKWARIEAIVGAENRIELVAKDLVNHFEKRQGAIEGKAMFVSMSRRICVDLYNEIAKLRPDWIDMDDDKGVMKVIMTGSASDGPDWQKHIRDKRRRRELGEIFKDPDSGFKLAIVRDMWLTGFDVPSLNTLYVDKPMKGHGLMQAIARVNRVYKDKEGGLIVDYLGIAPELKKALSIYTKSGGKSSPTFDQKEAIAVMDRNYEVVSDMFHGFDYRKFFSGTPKEKMQIIPAAMEHILAQDKGKERFIKNVTVLSKAYALAVPSEEAEKLRDDIGFFQAIKASILKTTTAETEKSDELIHSAIKQIVSEAVSSDEVIDIFQAAGMKKPEISILSDHFLAEVQGMQHKNLAFEALKKLLNDEIKVRFKFNRLKDKKFSEMIKEALIKYQNRSIDTAEVIKELIDIAKKMRDEEKRGKELGLTAEEEAFYDALADNGSATDILGNEVLKKMAVELTEIVRKNASIDWTKREAVQAKLRSMVKRLLRRYGYPPDKQKMATELVLDQAKSFAEVWAA